MFPMRDMVDAILLRIEGNFLLTKEFFPNVILGMLICVICGALLMYHQFKEPKYITFAGKARRIHFFLSILFGVILVSPLPLVGMGDIIRVLAVSVVFVVLFVAAYTDKYTATVIRAYWVLGVLAEILLLIVAHISGTANMNGSLLMSFFVCAVVNFVLSLFSYTLADMGLFLMGLLCFVIVSPSDVVFAFTLCEFVATAYFVVGSSIFVARAKKAGVWLKFPFTESILVGTIVSLFFVF